jgi:hypothetical protein
MFAMDRKYDFVWLNQSKLFLDNSDAGHFAEFDVEGNVPIFEDNGSCQAMVGAIEQGVKPRSAQFRLVQTLVCAKPSQNILRMLGPLLPAHFVAWAR